MKNSTLLLSLVGVLAMFGVNAAEPSPENNPNSVRSARPPEDKEQLERRLASVATLIEKSSAAKQIESSAVPQALALREKARELRQQAEQSFKAGNYVEASRFLDQTAKSMFEGVRLAAPEQIERGKKQRDFDTRMESVKALLEAQKRISAEKNQGAKGAATSRRIEGLIREAQAFATAGKLDEGRTLLDQVYVTTRTEIESMREGDTLVRSLNFATKEEEYLYEVNRNETHKMLVRVLLDEKRSTNSGLDGMVKNYLDKSESLRLSAQSLAEKKDFEGAVQMLEDSTKELVRAIRSAGVYIPG